MAILARCLERLPPGLPLGLLVFATVGGLAVTGGGYWPVAWGVASLGLLWVLAVALVVIDGVELRRLDAVALGCLAGLLAWMSLSIWWSLDRGQSVIEVQRGLTALAALALVLLLGRRATAAAALIGLAAACWLASIVAVAGWALAGAPYRLGISGSVEYPNALGLLAAMGLILALGFARPATTTRLTRLVAIGAAIVSAAALCLSASVGALAAVTVGLGISLLLAAAGRAALARTLCGIAVAAGFVVTAAGIIGLSSLSAETAALRATVLEREGAASASVQPRLRFWAVAWRSAKEAPLAGAGAGSFGRIWLQRRPTPTPARDAHNLYLETLAELGIVGIVLLAVALGAPLVAALRARNQALAPPAAGAYAAFLAHAGIDADWESALLLVAALVCGGALLVMSRPPRPEARPIRARAGAFAAVLVLMGVAYIGVIGNGELQRSRESAKVGALETTSLHARAALRWAPWSGESWCLLGDAALARGRRELAQARYSRGLDRDPNSWLCWRGMAQASRGPVRKEAVRHATALNPLGRS